MNPACKIAIAIPTWCRTSLVFRSIAKVIDDDRIGEIIICDDASEDGSYQKLREWVEDKGPKVRLYRNLKNLDCYGNKNQVVSLTSLNWVILFDSDNVMYSSYLDRIYDIPEWEEGVAYLPVFAKPYFDYRKFAGLRVTRSNVRNYMSNPTFRCALNTANYFFNRQSYLRAWNPSINPHTADSIYMNYRILDNGGALQFVPGLEYFHDVHPKSHYKLNHKKTGTFAQTVEKKLMAMR